MDFRFSAEDEAWRGEIRTWIEGEFGAGWRGFRGEDAEADYLTAAVNSASFRRHTCETAARKGTSNETQG